jgi:hypothetical protein
MYQSTKSIYLLLIAVAFSFTSCKNSDTKTGAETLQESVYHKNFIHLETPTQQFEIDNALGGTIAYKTGTELTIPENAFVTEDNKPVKGKVTVNYREFHSPAEIISSGVNMWYEEENKQSNLYHQNASVASVFSFAQAEEKISNKNMFESAGMMEIRVKVGNKTLKLALGKKIKVNMASNKKESNFNTYSYNDKTQKWSLITAAALVIPNKRKDSAIVALAKKPIPVEPTEPRQAEESTLVFDLDVNYTDFPELSAFKSVLWQYSGDKKNESIKNHSKIFAQEWNDIQVKQINGSNEYELTLKATNKTYTTTVMPVLKGKNLAKAQAQFNKQMEAYQKQKQIYQEQKNYSEKIANVFRKFEIETLGYINCDRPIPIGKIFFTSKIILPKDWEAKNTMIYIVNGQRKSVAFIERLNFTISQFENYSIVALSNDKKAALISTENINNAIKGQSISQNLQLQEIPGAIHGSEELDNFLNTHCFNTKP